MTRDKAIVLAGMFCVSNMGQPRPPADLVARAIKCPPTTPNSAAILFGESYMETDADERMFTEEATVWLRELSAMGDDEMARTWPDIAALYAEAEKLNAA